MSRLNSASKVGVDTGGTFTDFVWLDQSGRLQVHKQLSTPQDPSEAIVNGIGLLQVPSDATVVHGSTVATNALLQRKGAKVALLTTRGFKELLYIARQQRPRLYDFDCERSKPVVSRNLCFEVPERLAPDGTVYRESGEPRAREIDARVFRRVEALSGGASKEQTLERGPLQFSLDRMEVAWKGAGVPLTVTEFWIIHSLIRHPGHVRSRQQLMDDANVLVDDQTITSHVKRIRRNFLQADPDFDRLDTVYGAGYRWKPERESG